MPVFLQPSSSAQTAALSLMHCRIVYRATIIWHRLYAVYFITNAHSSWFPLYI